MRKFLIIMVCLFSLEMVKSAEIQGELSKNFLRLHIIANSDSEYDQEVKLAVRDGLLGLGSYDKKKLKDAAEAILLSKNAGYGAEISLRDRYVPQKTYKNIALPEGQYTCLDVILGNGGGENWWCVAYPPLCFTEALTGEKSESAKRELTAMLSQESLKTIMKNAEVTYKFKIVEDFQKIIKFLE